MKRLKLNFISIVFLVPIVLIISGCFLIKSEESKEVISIDTLENTIIPKPLSFEKTEGEFTLRKDTIIYVKGNTDEETEEIYNIAQFMKSKIEPATGYNLKVKKEYPKNKKNFIYLTTTGAEKELGSEGYLLNSSKDNIKIIGYKPDGIFKGIQTLRQLFPSEIEKPCVVKDIEWTIPAVNIKDKPNYEHRGIMIDVVRHFFTVDEVKRQIDMAAAYKINRVHLHLSDDQGWRLEIKKWPELALKGGQLQVGGGIGGFYTQEDFKDIVKYAQSRYVEIIPEFEMPGHSNAALASYGFLNPDGKPKDLYTGTKVGFSSFMTRDEKTYSFIEDIIKEISEISPSKYIHIGGDEVYVTSKEDYNYFMGRVSKIVQKYGKTPIAWDPADTSSDINSDTILQNWKNSNKSAVEKNMKMIISIAEKAYLDMKYNEKTPYGLTWAGLIPIDKAYNWDPIDYAPKELILGLESPLWTETIETEKAMDFMIYPRLLGYAEIGWTPREMRDYNEYKIRLSAHGERMENKGINYYKYPSIWN